MDLQVTRLKVAGPSQSLKGVLKLNCPSNLLFKY